MELTEAIKILQEIWRNTKFEDSRKRIAIETVLTYVRDSISKDKVKKKIDELELLKKALPIRTEIPRFIDYLKELLGE